MKSEAWASYRAAAEVEDCDGEPSDGCVCPQHNPEDYDLEDLEGGCSCFYRCSRHCKGPEPICRSCPTPVNWWGDMCEGCLADCIEAERDAQNTLWGTER